MYVYMYQPFAFIVREWAIIYIYFFFRRRVQARASNAKARVINNRAPRDKSDGRVAYRFCVPGPRRAPAVSATFYTLAAAYL